MARPKSVRAPTTASLPNNLRIPSTTPTLVKAIGKLSRPSLLELALLWLDDRNVESFPPYLQRENHGADDDEALPYPAAETIQEVRQAYLDLQDRKGGRREVVDRILEGDWRHGITLRQLAMADLRYMDDHPTSLRWTALELSRLKAGPKKSTDGPAEAKWSACVPRIQAATFVKALQHEISPLVKAHYHLARSSTLPLTFLRIFVIDSPYQSPRQAAEIFTDSSRVIYIAFPDSCPFVYSSVTAATGSKAATASAPHSAPTDSRSLQRLVREAIPKALSRPQARYTLKPTSLVAKNLPTLLTLRGPGRTNAANGAFSIFADAVIEGSPLDPRPSNTVTAEERLQEGPQKPVTSLDEKENAQTSNESLPPPTGTSSKRHLADNNDPDRPLSPASKKRRLAIHSRFGTSGSSLASAPLYRLDVRVLDSSGPEEDNENEQDNHPPTSTLPALSISFTGSDVISGIRKLAEMGIVDPERMPSWMTGEEAVSMMVVRRGRRIWKGT